jgi:hypothetical protein
MRAQPIEKSVGLVGAERNHTFMHWQRVAAFTPKMAKLAAPCRRRKRKPGAADLDFSAVTGERLRPVSQLCAADLNRRARVDDGEGAVKNCKVGRAKRNPPMANERPWVSLIAQPILRAS